MSTRTAEDTRPLALGPRCRAGLDAVRARARTALATRGLATLAVLVVALSLLSFGLDRPLRLRRATRAVLLALGAGALGVVVWRRLVVPLRRPLPDDELARVVEAHDPRLDWRLISAVQFAAGASSGAAGRDAAAHGRIGWEEDDEWRPGPGGSRELAALVIDDADALAASVDFAGVVPSQPVLRAAIRGAAVIAAAALLCWTFPTPARTWFQRNVLLSSAARWPQDTLLALLDARSRGEDLLGAARAARGLPSGAPVDIQGEEGLTLRVTQGADLTVAVVASGVQPSRVYLETTSDEGGGESLAMDALGDGRFRLTLDDIASADARGEGGAPADPKPFRLHARGGDGELGPILVRVVRQPWVESLALHLVPPPHTGQEPSTRGIEAGTLTLPVGTRVRLEARTSKPLARATLEERPTGAGAADVAIVHTTTLLAGGKGFTAEWMLERAGAFSLDVSDQDGLPLQSPARFALLAQADRAPEVELRWRGVGLSVTARARLRGEVSAEDDHGVVGGALRAKVSGNVGGEAAPERTEGAPLELVAPGQRAREARAPAALDLEPLGLVAGQALVLWAEATDGDPRGPNVGSSPPVQLRVVSADQLLNELLRRLHEQRLELERMIVEEEKLVQGLLGQDRTTLERAPRAHKDVSRAVTRAADVVSGVVDEMVTNDVLDEATWRKLREEVAAPLREMPQAGGALARARESAEAAAQAGEAERAAAIRAAGGEAGRVVTELQAIVARMGRIEELAELVAILKRIIERERELHDRTRRAGRPR